MNHNVNYIIFLVLAYRWLANAEVFTSISHLEPLITTQKKIIDNLDNYISKENRRINVLKTYLDRFKIEDEKAARNTLNYVENPINCYTLIKRLTHDLQIIESEIKNKTVYRKVKTVEYPEKADLIGAAQGLARLQKTYKLNITDLANGVLKGKFSYNNQDYIDIVTPLSASDCYELGRALFEEKQFKEGISWLFVALNKYNVKEKEPFTESDIIEHISYAYFALEDIKSGLEWTNNNLMVLDPEDPRYTKAKGAQVHYTQVLEDKAKERMKQKKSRDSEDNEVEAKSTQDDVDKIYKPLCRGEINLPNSVIKRLKCRYLYENNPFLKLAPIKIEQLYFKPDIFLLHEVLSDHEIQHIKNLSNPKLQRASVHDTKTNQVRPALYRICKVAWLPINKTNVTARVSQRISDITGLSMASAADLQISNYGIGGYYGPHYDFSRFQTKGKTFPYGNRIATVIFYLSDVAQGGATVFPQLGLTVFPVRGAALFWRNMHPSGEGDIATRHAGCPVLRGSKWIANSWLYQHGQELLQPCHVGYKKIKP